MLQEAIDIQHNAVLELIHKIRTKRELTFRAPTGSGKTRMMADFMNRILQAEPDVVFLVSTLSKGNLAEQNYKVFKDCADKNIFPHLNPHLISSEIAGEERLFIPEGFNVYVLPRDLYKDKSKLIDGGALLNFLQQTTQNIFGNLTTKKIYLIKDECHQATRNLDDISSNFFEKIINFSATPNLKRGQHPDVEISDDAAMDAKLIKKIQWGADCETVENAICKFEEIRKNYVNLLGVNPCLIIQISNKEKAEQEWSDIETILNKPEHQHLKWMSIVEKKDKCRTNDSAKKLKDVNRWKDYAKGNSSTIDIIIFKMVISEGWDIPRACMLYQVRDTKSKQLDEQVIGRVRRNPRLADFEQLSAEAQKLAMTAWIWGVHPIKKQKNPSEIATAPSPTPATPIDIDLEKIMSENQDKNTNCDSIFDLFAKLQKCNNHVKNLCYDYADTPQKWCNFCGHIEEVCTAMHDK